MKENPLKVVLVSSLNISVFDALDAGAVDFVKKPDMSSKNELANFYYELIGKIKIAHIAKLRIRTVDSPTPTIISVTSPASSAPVVSTSTQATAVKAPILLKLNLVGLASSQQVIAIGASTGGTEATLEILKNLPKDVPGIVITQHMPPGFTKMYADRLNKICQMEVREAVNGDRLTTGLALVAPGDKQMRLAKDAKGYFVRCLGEDKVSGHCPSVDVLFESVSKAAGSNAIGVILTGMGKDGADGLLKMRTEGAYTIGQDQASCVVYGMPKVAYEVGGVQIQSPISEIANILIKQLNKK
jgi:two-component system chemotaxis response regulator CheB